MEKKLLMYCLKTNTNLNLKEIGYIVGGMSDVAVSQAVSRLRKSKGKKIRNVLHELELKMEKCQM